MAFTKSADGIAKQGKTNDVMSMPYAIAANCQRFNIYA
jgi:hypothetical protein